MTPDEWVEVVRRIQANWPQQRIPRVSLAKWYDDLRDLPAEAVATAVESIYRLGREWPPNGAMILREVADQTLDAPPFGEAWAMVQQAVRSHGSQNHRRIVEALTAKHPAIGALADQISVRDIGMAPEGDTTMHAQARERYAGIVRKQHRELTHHGLPSAAAPQLRGAGRRAPQQIGGAIGELVAGLAPQAQEPAA